MTVAVIGCGPVGLCALINAQEYKPKHILAIDAIPSRLEQAKSLGAEPWNFKDNMDGLKNRIKELTDGRGLDAAIEVVGLSAALGTAFELVRPWGVVASIGVHNAEVQSLGFFGHALLTEIDPLQCLTGIRQEHSNPIRSMSGSSHIP